MEYYTLSSIEFHKILIEVSEIAVKNALIDAGYRCPIIWRADAIRLHGLKTIRKLEKYGLIKRKQHHSNSNYFYDVKELNYALTTEQRHRFFLKDEEVSG